MGAIIAVRVEEAWKRDTCQGHRRVDADVEWQLWI
jgi:hypothetical protein